MMTAAVTEHPSIVQCIVCSAVRKQLSQLATLMHAHQDVAATDEFPINVHLRYGGPF